MNFTHDLNGTDTLRGNWINIPIIHQCSRVLKKRSKSVSRKIYFIFPGVQLSHLFCLGFSNHHLQFSHCKVGFVKTSRTDQLTNKWIWIISKGCLTMSVCYENSFPIS